jgi:hypothetical protein
VRGHALILTCLMLLALALFAVPSAPAAYGPGGVAYDLTPEEQAAAESAGTGQPVVAGVEAKLLESGEAAAPAAAPESVKRAIWAANKIVGRPYRYGGGHARGFVDRGYDCSGTVSYALHGAALIDTPLDSSSFMSWGGTGAGAWITVYSNPGHAYAVIAGLRLDTSSAGDSRRGRGPRWRPALRSSRGFKARHPAGL